LHKNFNDITLEDLQKMSAFEILETVYYSLTTKEIMVENVSIKKEGCNMYELDFVKVKKYIKYTQNESVFKLQYPYINEDFDDDYRIKLKNRHEFIIADFLLYVKGKVHKYPFGIMKATLIGDHLYPFESSVYYEKRHNIFTESSYFFYDYKLNVYYQINEKKLRRAQEKLEKGEELNKYEVKALEYFRRLSLLKCSLGRLKEIKEINDDLLLGKWKEVRELLQVDWDINYPNPYY